MTIAPRRAAAEPETRTPWWYHAGLRLAHGFPIFAAFCACTHAAPESKPRDDAFARATHTSSDTAPTTAAAGEVTLQFAELERVSAAPFTTAHFGGVYAAEIRVSPAARDAYLTLVTDTEFAEGTTFVELLRDERRRRSAGALSLTRSVQGWRFARSEPDGGSTPQAALGFCSECHALAPAAPVFGPPRAAAASPPSSGLLPRN